MPPPKVWCLQIYKWFSWYVCTCRHLTLYANMEILIFPKNIVKIAIHVCLQWTLWSNTFWVCAQYSYKYRWYIIIKAKHCRQLYTTLMEQELLTLTEYQSSPLVVSKVRVTRSLVLCVYFADFCPFSIGNCVVCSSSIYGFWLPLWHLQTFLVKESIFYG